MLGTFQPICMLTIGHSACMHSSALASTEIKFCTQFVKPSLLTHTRAPMIAAICPKKTVNSGHVGAEMAQAFSCFLHMRLVVNMDVKAYTCTYVVLSQTCSSSIVLPADVIVAAHACVSD